MVVFFKDPFGNRMINQHLRTTTLWYAGDFEDSLVVFSSFSSTANTQKKSLGSNMLQLHHPWLLARCPIWSHGRERFNHQPRTPPEIQRTCTGASNVHPATASKRLVKLLSLNKKQQQIQTEFDHFPLCSENLKRYLSKTHGPSEIYDLRKGFGEKTQHFQRWFP